MGPYIKCFSSQSLTYIYSGSPTAQTTGGDAGWIKTWSLLRPWEHGPPLCSVHHAFVCVSWVPSHLIWFKHKAPVFHSLCLAQDETPLFGNICCPCPPATAQGQISYCLWLIGPSSLHQHVHDRLQGDLRQYKSWLIVSQVMIQLREINQMECEMCQYLD